MRNQEPHSSVFIFTGALQSDYHRIYSVNFLFSHFHHYAVVRLFAHNPFLQNKSVGKEENDVGTYVQRQ